MTDHSREAINIFKTHARQLAGGKFFEVNNGVGGVLVICTLSDDYYKDCKLEGFKLFMIYDPDKDSFRLSLCYREHGFGSEWVKLEEPENIGREMDGLLTFYWANHQRTYRQLFDRKPVRRHLFRRRR